MTQGAGTEAAAGGLGDGLSSPPKEVQKRPAATEEDLNHVFELPEEFQHQLAFEYDMTRFPFLEALLPVLKEDEGTDLSKLHETEQGRFILHHFRRRPQKVEVLGPRGNPWNRNFLSSAQHSPEAFRRLMAVYEDFLRSVVLSHLETDCIAFQTLPTFRCHMPGCGAPGRPHRDADYHHAHCEVNFWMPLTAVFGSNSLFAESTRGAGDFRSFDLSVGWLMRFYGNQVWHYTVPNETESTRVSLDFRVIRRQDWSPGAFSFFKLGGYFSVMTADGVLPRGSAELRRLQEEMRSRPPSPRRGPRKDPFERGSKDDG
mmetsp:Transcript_60153/g.130459  ORF Transcript_60153/g.130459 Transcript_60153/m.130459 type:complete len:315 (+) Transcript_60153:91-1035(+)